MNTEKLQNALLYRYRFFIAYGLIIAASIAALFYRIGDLLPGFGPSETRQGLDIVADSATILERGVYLPYNLLQKLSLDIFGETAIGLRLPSALCALLVLIGLFALLHMWHRDKIAIASVLFLGTSSWFLNFARSGTPEIFMALSLVLIFLSGTVVRHSQKPRLPLVLAAFGVSIALYAPYSPYLVLLFIVLYWKQIRRIAKQIEPLNLVIIALIGLASLAPLLYGLISDLENLKLWLGIGENLPTISQYFANLTTAAKHLLWASQENAEFHLGNLSMLDIFTSTMTALGLYHYEQHHHLLRTRFIMYSFGLLVLVLGLGATETNYFVLIPLVYILAATGVVTLLTQWNKIFPVNPFARTLGLLPLAFAILMTSQYHIDRYFSAWALNPTVKEAYAIEPALLNDAISAIDAKRILIISEEDLVDSIRFTTLPNREGRRIDIVTSVSDNRLKQLPEKYDMVFVDYVRQDKQLRTFLGEYLSTEIESPRDLRPIAFTAYNLKEKAQTVNY